MSLKEYQGKRDFNKTAEPEAKLGKGSGRRFVIQKHAATRLHYDFRLELGGTLKSWAVPKGIPFKKGDKRLAVEVEDHPVAYIDFEGTIPKGQYGGGTVMVWDRGTYEPLSKAPTKELAGGKLHFVLNGEKLKGEWYLVRLRDEKQWLLIKAADDMTPVSEKMDNTSALSGKTMSELSKGDRVWKSRPVHKVSHAKQHKSKPGTPTPLPEFVEPMQAKVAESAPRGDWLYEIKFDGFRAIALRGSSEARLLSRNKIDLGGKFPEVMESVSALDVQDATIDGEIVALDEQGRSSFQLLQAFELGQNQPPLFFYAFDLLRLNGKDFLYLPIEERKAKLEELLTDPPGAIRYSATLGDDPELLLKQARKFGLEGLIGKRAGSRYEPGQRSGAWIKLKLQQQQEFVIGGYTDPAGGRKYFGALLVGIYRDRSLYFAGRVGTGFTDKLLKSLLSKFNQIRRGTCPFVDLPEDKSKRYGQAVTPAEMKRCHWIEPVLVCEVKFTEWTRDDRLRQPVFLGLREDKRPEEVVREKGS